MASQSRTTLRARADDICARAVVGETIDTEALPGAGSAPGVTMPSAVIALPGDRLAELRDRVPPVIARPRDGRTLLDLRSVDPSDDPVLVTALQAITE